MFSFRIVVHYTTTIGDQTWHGSTATTAPIMYLQAASESDAEAMIRNSGLVPVVGESWGMGSIVTRVDLNLSPAPDVAIAPF